MRPRALASEGLGGHAHAGSAAISAAFVGGAILGFDGYARRK
jgi:fucose permease